MTIHRVFRLALLLSILTVSQPVNVDAALRSPRSDATQQDAGTKKTVNPAANGKITLDFKEIELPDLIQTISELTGKNFLYDETVRGKVTIITPSKITLDEAYNLFLTVLNVKGFTVVPSGGINKIVSTKQAKENNLPTITSQRKTGQEQYVTRLVPLEHIDVTTLATTVLAPLIPKTGNVVAYAPSNTLIITDSAANIERLVEIIHQLDVPSDLEVFEVIILKYAQAKDLAALANEVISQGAVASPSRRRRAANVQAAAEPEAGKVIPYERTNALVVMATTEDMATIRGIVEQLDKPPERESSHINVYYLENADAENLATTLNEILTGIRTKARTTPGQKTDQEGQALVSEGLTITADKPTNSLIINASPQDYETLKGIIDQLDIKRKQVFVETLILELSMDATKEVGSSLQGAIETGSDSVVFGTSNLNTGPTGIGSLSPPSGGTVPTLLTQTLDGILLGGLFSPITVVGPDGSEITVPALSALIDLSKSNTDVNILSAPRLLTSDNEEAEIVIGSNVPIITSRLTDTGGTGLAQSVSVERQDVALTLRFTPQITEGDQIRLNVYQEITDLVSESSQQSVGNVNEVGPTLTKRLLRNTVLAENGRTVVLGGLISSNKQQSITKVPLLGDIPVLGWLFKRKGHTERKTNLLVFITPHIIKDSTDLARATHKAKRTMDRFREQEMNNTLETDSLDLLQMGDDPAAGN